MKTKQELRKIAKQIRQKLDIQKISKNIHKMLFDLPEYHKAKNIFIYHSFQDEVNTLDLFNDKEKNWFIPRISNDNLLVCKYCSDSLIENNFGIKEPSTSVIEELSSIDIVILPALMADKKGNRLGYGKGFYDRFLNSLNHTPLKILLLPEEVLQEEIPCEQHDCKVDLIITQCNIYRF